MADTATKLPVKSDDKAVAKGDLPWSPFESLRSEIDHLFDDFSLAPWRRPLGRPSFGKFLAPITSPAIDLVEKEKAYEITAEVAGMDPKEIEVRLSNGILTIKGEKRDDKDEKRGEYYVSERRYGSFQRSFQLPQGVDAEKIDASLSNGILTVNLPKSAEAQKTERTIPIAG